MTETVALIVAGGRSIRAGGTRPKQYQNLAGIPMLRRTVQCFAKHPAVTKVRVVLHPEDHALYEAAVKNLDLPPPVHGGPTRQESCRNGLEALQTVAPTNVLIHDAARPFVDNNTISRVIEALSEETPAAVAAIPVADTLKRADYANRVKATVDRTDLWHAQTPQGFRYTTILEAHRQQAGQNHSDDASVAEAAGFPVVLTLGNAENIKVTTAEDFTHGERILGVADIRVGTGLDVHPFEDGDHVILCGVKLTHNRGLRGHSDSDVGLHALTDALLGTIGAGDIGTHFPTSDPQWRGTDSMNFLSHAAELVRQKGGTIRHVDVTLICETPMVGPHRDAMRLRLSEILSLDMSRVSVKATTTDGLGFLGRREGIAAQAATTVLFS